MLRVWLISGLSIVFSREDLRAATHRATDVRLNYRQLRLLANRYVHVFALWFRFRLHYRSFFSNLSACMENYLLRDTITFFWYWFSSSDLL